MTAPAATRDRHDGALFSLADRRERNLIGSHLDTTAANSSTEHWSGGAKGPFEARTRIRSGPGSAIAPCPLFGRRPKSASTPNSRHLGRHQGGRSSVLNVAKLQQAACTQWAHHDHRVRAQPLNHSAWRLRTITTALMVLQSGGSLKVAVTRSLALAMARLPTNAARLSGSRCATRDTRRTDRRRVDAID